LSPFAEPVAALLMALERAPDAASWHEVFRHRYRQLHGQLHGQLPMHSGPGTPSEIFESAACTARAVCAPCLPLGMALIMHLYPLCALRCVPLPWLSTAHRRRAELLSRIDGEGLILANAGSERARGEPVPLTVTRAGHDLLIDGTFDYVSLAHVADLVLFCAPAAGGQGTVFCAADLRAESVNIGETRFPGSMRLSDTCALTFRRHRVPRHRYIEVPTASALECLSHYQRSWFHLLLAEGYLARIEHLHLQHELPRSKDHLAGLNDLACLRQFALHLLDSTQPARAVPELARVTAAIKLRVSCLAQATADALRGRDETSAAELGYIRLQPTSDERILRSLDIIPWHAIHRSSAAHP
jgi:hypothetical protein